MQSWEQRAILVAESNTEKLGGEMPEPVRKAIEGTGLMGPSANRITLVRDANGDGKPEVHETFLAGLNQPFGMQLLGDWLYVANTDALVRYGFHRRRSEVRGVRTTRRACSVAGRLTARRGRRRKRRLAGYYAGSGTTASR